MSTALAVAQQYFDAWNRRDAAGILATIAPGGTHGASVNEFFGSNLGAGGAISVWIPHHIGPMWVRCPQCGRMTDSTKANGVCRDGHPLPEPPPYW